MTPRVNGESNCRKGQRLAGALLLGGMTIAIGAHAQSEAAPGAAASAPAASPAAAAQPAAAPAAAGGGMPSAFDVNEFIVRGNTTLSSLEIEQAVYPFEGPGKTLDDVNGARDALQKVYQDKGYQSVVVELPQQQVKGGVILLQVV